MTKILKVDPAHISFDSNDIPIINNEQSKKHLLEAANALKHSNDPVAIPTETVYGLAASAFKTEAVLNIYKAKNRPADNPLILHISSVSMLESILNSSIPLIYQDLIKQYWPGPLTIVLPIPADSKISSACTVGSSTFAVRMPAHPVARALISMVGEPLAAPSANASTRPSTTTAQHVFDDLQGKIGIILDGGPCNFGVESTVIDGTLSPPQLLRPGGVTLEQITSSGHGDWSNVVVAHPNAKPEDKVRTPGMKYKHYAPKTPVFLVSSEKASDVNSIINYLNDNQSCLPSKRIALLRSIQLTEGDSKKIEQAGYQVLDCQLGTTGAEISRNIFSLLRSMDLENVDVIVVEGTSNDHEGLANMNRLRKAATTFIE